MIRIIVRTDDASLIANAGGGAVQTEFRTFKIDAPELEAYLREPEQQGRLYAQRQVVGVELSDTRDRVK